MLSKYQRFCAHEGKTLAVLVAIKVVVFVGLWLLQVATEDPSSERIGWFLYGNDTHSYLDPIESLVDDGVYAMPTGPTAFRMPGLLPLYGPLYLVFGKSIALHLLILINLLADVLGTVLLFRILSTFFRTPAAFLAAALYALFPRISALGYVGITETLAAFFFVLLLWSLIQWRGSKSPLGMILVPVAMTFLIFLKPVSGVLLAIISFYVLISGLRQFSVSQLRRNAMNTAILVSIPILMLGAWTWRNHQAFDQFIPLTSAFGERSVELKFKEFCRTTGTEFQVWNGKDALAWFAAPNNYLYNEAFQKTNPFDGFIFSESLTIDSLVNIRTQWHRSMDKSLSKADRDRYDALAYAGFDRAIHTFKSENTFHYYVTSRLILTYRLFFINDSFSPYRLTSWPFKLIQLWFLASYYALILFSLVGMLLAILHRKSKLMLTLILFAVFVFAHIMIGIVENRYLLPVIPLLMVFGGYTFNLIWDQFRSRFLNPSS